MKYNVLLLFIFIAVACKQDVPIQKLQPAKYRGELKVNDTLFLPFTFEVLSESELHIFNAEEVIMVKNVTYANDSVYIQTPVFEGFIAAKIDGNAMKGHFVKEGLNRIMDFKAKQNETRFDITTSTKYTIQGSWETLFSPNSEEYKYIAKGIFKQYGNKVTGTFRTTTGDYRYLEGVLNGNTLQLSTFDGAHAFLFTAEVNDCVMNGMFYSGNHFKEPFTAKRNENYELPDANSLTYLKEGFDRIEFSFPDENGKMVSLDDDRFRDKVVLLQIMGSWCPNCLDESRFYSEFYNNHSNDDLEVIALAFEYVKTQEKAFQNIKRLKENVNIKYPVVLAQYGSSSKAMAQEKLPMLNHILSYPTTIFIDKKGTVRKIHTGFNGPATGEKFITFKEEFEAFVNKLFLE